MVARDGLVITLATGSQFWALRVINCLEHTEQQKAHIRGATQQQRAQEQSLFCGKERGSIVSDKIFPTLRIYKSAESIGIALQSQANADR